MVLRNCINSGLEMGIGLICLVASCAIAAESDSSAKTSIEDPFRMLDWKGYNQVSTLADGTSLYLYVAQSAAVADPDSADPDAVAESTASFRVSFLPRFRCSPLVTVVGSLPEILTARDRVDLVQKYNKIELTIDDEPLRFPALVEFEGDEIHSYYDAALERRMTLRILIEIGSRLQIRFGDGRRESLSLLGSQRVLETALGRCKKHS